jgi:predicted NBD/HSP70 family sugar kinase
LSQFITLTRGRFGSAASQVVEQARAYGPVSRDELTRRTDLSSATVNRTVASLLLAGVLRERPDKITSGANGRPGVPVEVDPSRYVTLGFHLGRGVDTVAIGDLRGQVIVEERLPRPVDRAPALADLAGTAARLLAGQPGRAPLAAGLVAPWLDLDLDQAAAGEELHNELGLDVATADHVAGVAATEFLHRRTGTPGATLYVYARNTVGFALAADKSAAGADHDGGRQTEVSRTGSLTHFPVEPTEGTGARCVCGRTGCLAAAYSDHALVARAAGRDLIPAGSDIDTLLDVARRGPTADQEQAHGLLLDRARALGRVAAIVRDITTPDRVVLVGQAFTGYPPVLEAVSDAFTAHTALGLIDLSFTRFGAGVQAVTACTVALGPVYDDPLGVVPKGRPVSSGGSHDLAGAAFVAH